MTKDCNETVEDENEVNVVVTPNASGVQHMQKLSLFPQSQEQLKPQSMSIRQSLIEDGNIHILNTQQKPPSGKKFTQQQQPEPQSFLQSAQAKGVLYQQSSMTASSNTSKRSSSNQHHLSNTEVKQSNSQDRFQKQITDQREAKNFQSGERLQRKHDKQITEMNQQIAQNSVQVIKNTNMTIKQEKTKAEDPETELLKQEYLKLKQTLNQLKNTATPATSQTQSQFESSKQQKRKVTAPSEYQISLPLHSQSVQQEITEQLNTPSIGQQRQAQMEHPHSSQNVSSKTRQAMETPTQNQPHSHPKPITRPNSSSQIETVKHVAHKIQDGTELTFSNEKLVLETRREVECKMIDFHQSLDNFEEEQINKAQKNQKKMRDKSNDKKIYIQQHSKTTQVLKRKQYVRSNSIGSQNSNDQQQYESQGSSFEDFQLAAATGRGDRSNTSKQAHDYIGLGTLVGAAGMTTESDDDDENNKHLIVSNLKSSVSNMNTSNNQVALSDLRKANTIIGSGLHSHNRKTTLGNKHKHLKKSLKIKASQSVDHYMGNDDNSGADQCSSSNDEVDYSRSNTSESNDSYEKNRKHHQKPKKIIGEYSPEGDDEYESSGRRKKKLYILKHQHKNQGGILATNSRDKRSKQNGTYNGQTHHRHHQQQHQSSSVTRVKNRKDHKQLKININMNSVTGTTAPSQYAKVEAQHPIQSNEEILQRQILQQQQLLLAALAAQQHQFQLQPHQQSLALQQQIALQQQQLLMSQPLFQQHNMNTLANINALGTHAGITPQTMLGMQVAASTNFSDVASNYAQQLHINSFPTAPIINNPTQPIDKYSQNLNAIQSQQFTSQNIPGLQHQNTVLLTQRNTSNHLHLNQRSSQSPQRPLLQQNDQPPFMSEQSYHHQPKASCSQTNLFANINKETNQFNPHLGSLESLPSPNEIRRYPHISSLIEDSNSQAIYTKRKPFHSGASEPRNYLQNQQQQQPEDYHPQKRQHNVHQSRNRTIQNNYSSPVKDLMIVGVTNETMNSNIMTTQNQINSYLPTSEGHEIPKEDDDYSGQQFGKQIKVNKDEEAFTAAYGVKKQRNVENNRLIEPRRTGQFGQLFSEHSIHQGEPETNYQNGFQQNQVQTQQPQTRVEHQNQKNSRSRSSTSSQDSMIDEGVTAKYVQMTINKSPNTATATAKRLIEDTTSLTKGRNNNSKFTGMITLEPLHQLKDSPLTHNRSVSIDNSPPVTLNLQQTDNVVKYSLASARGPMQMTEVNQKYVNQITPEQETDDSKNRDQDRKGPQALIIGFENDNLIKDPFKGKPVLKHREAIHANKKPDSNEGVSSRSKSAKGASTTTNTLTNRLALNRAAAQKKKNQQESLIAVFELKDEKEDRQLRSPPHSFLTKQDASIPQQNAKNRLIKEKSPVKKSIIGESPMKKAVVIIQNEAQNKESVINSKNNVINKPRPGTSKAGLGLPQSKKPVQSAIIPHSQTPSATTTSNRTSLKERILSKQQQQQQQQSNKTPSSSSKSVVGEPKAVMIDLNSIIKHEQPPKQANPKVAPLSVAQSKRISNQELLTAEELDIEDPNHNKDLVIEILDKKAPTKAGEVSLQEMFKTRRGDVLNRLETRKHQDQDDATITHRTVIDLQSPPAHLKHSQDFHISDADCTQPQNVPVVKREKTKEELFQLRKQMMKSRIKRQEDNFTPQNAALDSASQSSGTKKGDQQEELKQRLAQGKKTQIDQKEMKRLTRQNYHNLPEIKKKREEDIKKQEHLARKAATQEYLKQLDESRKKKAAAMQKKRLLAMETASQEK